MLEQIAHLIPDGFVLNPLQEEVLPHIHKDANVVIAAPTASGKSFAAQMLTDKHLQAGQSIVYLAPMKALVEEKKRDWENDYWKGYKKCIITGDYMFTQEKLEELNEADIIVITPESLVSKLRNIRSEKVAWLDKVGAVIIDECHLIGNKDRGANLEAALLELTFDFPNISLYALSGTIPNYQDFGQWFKRLNDKETITIKSNYRSVPVEVHFKMFRGRKAFDTESYRINDIIQLVEAKQSQQFLVVVFKKTFGNNIMSALREKGITVEFHNASRSKSERETIERAFKSGTIRVLICTQTLIAGVNLPARNVIVTHAEAGGGDIDACDLLQAGGRAGRPGYDTEGDVYYLLPERDFDRHKYRIINGEQIISQMVNPHVMATHFVGAIYLKRISTAGDFYLWYDRTLAQQQRKYTQEERVRILQSSVDDMKFRGIVKEDIVNGVSYLALKRRGTICAQMYFDPYYFYDLVRNLQKYTTLTNPTDADLAVALGKCTGLEAPCYDYELSDIPLSISRQTPGSDYLKACTTYYFKIRNDDVPSSMSSLAWQIRTDLDRVREVMCRAQDESENWDVDDDFIPIIFTRVKKGFSHEQARMALSKFRKNEIRELAKYGLYTLSDVKASKELASRIIKPSRLRELGIG